MLKTITKRGLSLLMIICMLMSVLPAVGVSAAASTGGSSGGGGEIVCNVLFEEDFEDNESSFEFSNSSAKSTNVITTECASTDGSGYGMGSYNLPIVNSEDNYIIKSFMNGSKSMKAISMIDYTHSESTETYGYSVELSFDWNPYDIGSAPKTLFSIIGNPDPQPETYQDKPVMGITYTGGNTETSGRTIVVTNNSRSNNIGEFDLTQILGDEIWDEEHIYRVRFVFNTYSTAKEVDGTKYAGSCTIYIDGVELGTYDYLRNSDRDYLTGIHFESNKKQANVIDNVKLIEYWNALSADTEGTSKYVNDDALVTAIRNAEKTAASFAATDAVADANAAIAAAKVVHTNASSTKTQMDAAANELNAKIAKIKEYKYVKVLLDEDFENVTEENPSKINFVKAVASHQNTFEQIPVASSVYGEGDYNFSFTDTTDEDTFNDRKLNMVYSLLDDGAVSTQALGYKEWHTESSDTYGYTAELSFDWNPNDINASAPYTTFYLYTHSEKGVYASAPMLGIKYTGGDQYDHETNPSGRKLTVFRNSESNILEENIDLASIIGDEVWDEDHTYRVRFVIEPYTAKKSVTAMVNGVETTTDCAGDCTLYIDGVKIGTYAYINNSKRVYLTALYYSSNKQSACYFDNVKLVEYWDALGADTEGTSKYVNDDALVTAIRNAEYALPSLAYDNQIIDAKAALASAKAAFEASDRTQSSVDAAATTLVAKMTEIDGYEDEDKTIYNVLFDEDFEDNSSDITYVDGNLDSDGNPQRDYAHGDVTATTGSEPHGYGNYNYKMYGTARDGSAKPGTYEAVYKLSEGIVGKSIKGGVHTAESETKGYTIDLSFDWNMDDSNLSSFNLQTKAGENTTQTNWRAFFTVYHYPDQGTFEIRNTGGIVDTIDIDSVFGIYTRNEDHAYRMRFSVKPYEAVQTVDEVNYAGEITVYIDGTQIGTYKYYENARFNYFFGLSYYSTTLNNSYIDNIRVMETWDALKASYSDTTVEYITDDALIGAIRTAQHKSEKLDDISKAIAENAIADAIAVYEAQYKTQSDIDSATEELKTVMSELRAIIPVHYTWDGEGGVNQYKEATKYQDAVYGDLHFPSNFVYNATTLDMQWASDKPEVIDAKGNVIRPTANTYVNLTVSFTDGSSDEVDYAEQNFKVRVLAGGDVVVNNNLNSVSQASAEMPSKNGKFMVSVTGKAGDYTFTAGGQTVSYTFTKDGDYDIIYDTSAGTYTVYQNCEAVATDSITLGSVSDIVVTGVQMTKLIAISLDISKAFVSAMTYTDGTYEFGIPTPGSTLKAVTIKAREDIEDSSLIAAVYGADGRLYSVCMTDAEANKGDTLIVNLPTEVKLPSGDEFSGAVVKVMLWKNNVLQPQMPAAVYNVDDLYDERTVIYMIGDSTMCNYEDAYYPMTGWGQVFGNYFDSTEVVVDNRAVGGKTTMWFAERGEFDKIMSQIKPGDYLFMQFAHNDQKAQYGIDETRFKGYLNEFIAAVEEKGAIPVLCTSIERRNRSSLGKYPQYMRDVATANEVMLLEMNTYSGTILEGLTSDESMALYCWVPGTVDGNTITVPYMTYDTAKLDKYKSGKNDNTHFSGFGANVWANYAAYLLKTNGSGLAGSVLDTVTEASTSVETIKANILSYATEE